MPTDKKNSEKSNEKFMQSYVAGRCWRDDTSGIYFNKTNLSFSTKKNQIWAFCGIRQAFGNKFKWRQIVNLHKHDVACQNEIDARGNDHFKGNVMNLN